MFYDEAPPFPMEGEVVVTGRIFCSNCRQAKRRARMKSSRRYWGAQAVLLGAGFIVEQEFSYQSTALSSGLRDPKSRGLSHCPLHMLTGDERNDAAAGRGGGRHRRRLEGDGLAAARAIGDPVATDLIAGNSTWSQVSAST
jgi:hypothetical protein